MTKYEPKLRKEDRHALTSNLVAALTVLTKREVEKARLFLTYPKSPLTDRIAADNFAPALHTIEAMAELLERWQWWYDTEYAEQRSESLDTASLLHTYHGTKGGDDDGK